MTKSSMKRRANILAAQAGWVPEAAASIAQGRPMEMDCAAGLPQERIVAAAKAMRGGAPEAFASDVEAIEAYLRTPQGNLDYLAYRQVILSGDPSLPRVSSRT